jgi:hypothetical protein
MDQSNPAERRKLWFDSIDELYDELEQIKTAEADGRLRTLGSWTPGQILSHLAAWVEYAYEGFPMKPAPWLIRVFLRWQLKKYLRGGMPSGVRIPKVEGGTTGADDLPFDEAAGRLRVALERLQSDEPARYDSPAFGALSHEQRIQLNLRHAELHLSFLQY